LSAGRARPLDAIAGRSKTTRRRNWAPWREGRDRTGWDRSQGIRSCCVWQRAADFGRRAVWSAARGLAGGIADRDSGADRESAVRVGDAGDCQRGADDSDRRSEDGAGGRDGIHVAGAVFDSGTRRVYAGSGREAGRFADGGAARYLLRTVHGEYGGALWRAAGNYAAGAG
jgi:hypothetical protein